MIIFPWVVECCRIIQSSLWLAILISFSVSYAVRINIITWKPSYCGTGMPRNVLKSGQIAMHLSLGDHRWWHDGWLKGGGSWGNTHLAAATAALVQGTDDKLTWFILVAHFPAVGGATSGAAQIQEELDPSVEKYNNTWGSYNNEHIAS